MCSRFLHLCPGSSGNAYNRAICNNQFLFAPLGEHSPSKAWTNAKSKSLTRWLNTPSKFYTRLCEFPITRRLAIYINLVALCVLVGAAAIEQRPLVSIIATALAVVLAVAINKIEKKGGTL